MWGDLLYDLTPVEQHESMYFKRDDKFAPKGYGNINGAKLRQCIYLVDKWVKEENIQGVVSGSVSQSPQHAFISEICRHYGIGCVITHSKKNIADSLYLNIAAKNGSKLVWQKVGYAKTLGAIAKRMLDVLPNHKFLETNITLDEKHNSWADIAAFHRIGAEQVKNIPTHVDKLVIPCGSCNSVTSILLGLVLFPKPNIKEIHLMGIGNHGSNNIGYIEDRLSEIVDELDLDVNVYDVFDFGYVLDRSKRHAMQHHNLNGSGFCSYTDTMQEKAGSIIFHPRYEGKCIRYMKQNLSYLWNEKTLFWIVGSDIKG